MAACVIDVEEFVGRRGEADAGVVEGNPTAPAATFLGLLAAGGIDEDPAHGFGRGGEEVTAAVPGLTRIPSDEPQVRLVH